MRENIQFKIRDDISVFIPHVMESLFVAINTNKDKTYLILGIMLRPNTAPRADMDIFMSKFNDINEIISKGKKRFYLWGILISIYSNIMFTKRNTFLDNILIPHLMTKLI